MIDTKKINKLAKEEEAIKQKILLLEGLMRGLHDSITSLVESSGLKDDERQQLFNELKEKSKTELADISKELQNQRLLLDRIQRGEA